MDIEGLNAPRCLFNVPGYNEYIEKFYQGPKFIRHSRRYAKKLRRRHRAHALFIADRVARFAKPIVISLMSRCIETSLHLPLEVREMVCQYLDEAILM